MVDVHGHGKVLLVEDQNPYLYQALLDAYNGFEFVVVERGDRAKQAFIDLAPVLVLMDVRLPVLNGIEAVKQIRKISKIVPIVVITAYDDRNTRQRAMAAGANDFFAKPFSYKQLYTRMVELVAASGEFSKKDEHIDTLILNKQRRLQALQAKQAIFGVNTPPETMIEIEDLHAEIEELRGLRNAH